MVNKNQTTKIRIYRSIYNELNFKFPGIHHADLLAVIYNTSAVKLEGMLRKPKKPLY